MPRPVHNNLRRAGLAEEAPETAIVLVLIEHPAITAEWGGPLRLSSDDTTVLSEEPYTMGTRSNGHDWLFILMEFLFSDDRRDAPPSCQIAFENVEREMTRVVRAVRDPATVTMLLTTPDDPDFVEERYKGLTAVRATYDETRITLDLSLENFTKEPWPSRRMTKRAFPGLWN